MSDGVFGQWKARGEEWFARISAELMKNPNFLKAMEAAWKGKAKLDENLAAGLKRLNIPTRTEFKRALRRIDELEAKFAELQAKLAREARRPAARKPRKAAPGHAQGGAQE